MSELFYWLFNMSVTVGLTGLIIWALCRVKRLPRRLTAALWIIPFLRAWVPVGVGNPYSLLALLTRFTARTVPVGDPDGAPLFSVTNFVGAAEDYAPLTYKNDALQTVFGAGAWVWLAGVAGLTLLLIAAYISALRGLKDASRVDKRVYRSARVTAPAVYGVLRPKIVLPAEMDAEDLPFVLRHERAHLRRGDNLWRLLAFCTAAFHWFNPLVWVFLPCFLTQLELACDESVLARCGRDCKKEYAALLVSAAQTKNGSVSAFGGADVRARVERILTYRKLSWIAAAGCAAFAIALASALLTNGG